jgi:hypothetical protein
MNEHTVSQSGPFQGAIPPNEPLSRAQVLTEEQERAVWEACKNGQYYQELWAVMESHRLLRVQLARVQQVATNYLDTLEEAERALQARDEQLAQAQATITELEARYSVLLQQLDFHGLR